MSVETTQSMPQHIRQVFAEADCLFTAEQVDKALDTLAEQLSEDLHDENPIFLCVLIGGIIPMGNLLVRLDFPLEIDYVHATRYGDELSGGEMKWLHYPKSNLKDRTVVIIEDVLDGGITLKHVCDYCREMGTKQIKTVALVDKEEGRVPGGLAKADYTGIVAENRFLFGYGMDYKGYLRNAPGIYALAEENK